MCCKSHPFLCSAYNSAFHRCNSYKSRLKASLINRTVICMSNKSIHQFQNASQTNIPKIPTSLTRSQLDLYAKCIFEPTDIVEIRQLPTGRSTWIQANKLNQRTDYLLEANQRKQHIYAGVNPRSRRGGRRYSDISCARCLFADIDNSSIQNTYNHLSRTSLPAPTLIIASGHGVHLYWRTNLPIFNFSLWSMLQRRLINLLDADKAIHDPARIMRLPGFINHKQPEVLCIIIDAEPKRIYTLNQLMDSLPESSANHKTAYSNNQISPKRNFSANDITRITNSWRGVRKGNRNCKAFQHAAFLINDADLSIPHAWSILKQWNCTNQPPLSEAELNRAFGNAGIYGRKSRSLPAQPTSPYSTDFHSLQSPHTISETHNSAFRRTNFSQKQVNRSASESFGGDCCVENPR